MRHLVAIVLGVAGLFCAAFVTHAQSAPATTPATIPTATPATSRAAAPATTPATAPTTMANGQWKMENAAPPPALTPGSRILKTFDFEEEKLGNFETIPMYWNKVAGRGYPLYTGGQFDKTVFRSASHSFALTLDGGSVAYQYAPGKLPIDPNSDYCILGFVKTTALPYARAEIAAWFADEKGEPVPGTEMHSDRWASRTGTDDWHVLAVYVSGQQPTARSLVLQVGLLQPQQLSDRRLGKFALYEQDIKGTAWFDDITVFQLPRVSLTAPAVGNLFAPGQRAELNLVVSDLGRDQLTANLTVTDAAGARMHRAQWPITVAAREIWTQHATLPALPPGLYTAVLEVATPHAVITQRQLRFAVLAPLNHDAPPAPEFGLLATRWPVEAWEQIPAIAAHCGVGLVKLPACRSEPPARFPGQKEPPFDELLATLQRQEINLLAGLAEIPSQLTAQVNERGDSGVSLLEVEANIWQPYLSFIMTRYAGSISLWEIGHEGDAFYQPDPRWARLYARARQDVRGMVAGSKVALPWNALYDFDPKEFPDAVLELHLPASIKSAQIPTYINSFKTGATEVLAVVEPLEDSRYARLDRLHDFAQRIVLARAANPRAVLIDLPMTRQGSMFGQTSEPQELLLIYRTLVRQLGGAAYRGEVFLEPGLRALLFDRQGVGTLVLWNQNGAGPQVQVHAALGPHAAALDLWGHAVPLAVANDGATLTVTGAPLLIDQVDTRLALLRGSFSLAHRTVPAGAGMLQTQVLLRNPYRDPLTGTLRLQPPPGWTLEPPVLTLALPAGGQANVPVTLRYPYNEFAGDKVLRGRLSTAGDSAQSIDLSTHLEVTSSVVEMECLAAFLPNGDLVLQQMLTNITGSPLNAQAYALVPGLARQQRFVLDLQPGQTVIKRFVFPHAAAAAGKTAALGLRQNDGTTLMTKAVPLN